MSGPQQQQLQNDGNNGAVVSLRDEAAWRSEYARILLNDALTKKTIAASGSGNSHSERMKDEMILLATKYIQEALVLMNKDQQLGSSNSNTNMNKDDIEDLLKNAANNPQQNNNNNSNSSPFSSLMDMFGLLQQQQAQQQSQQQQQQRLDEEEKRKQFLANAEELLRSTSNNHLDDKNSVSIISSKPSTVRSNKNNSLGRSKHSNETPSTDDGADDSYDINMKESSIHTEDVDGIISDYENANKGLSGGGGGFKSMGRFNCVLPTIRNKNRNRMKCVVATPPRCRNRYVRDDPYDLESSDDEDDDDDDYDDDDDDDDDEYDEVENNRGRSPKKKSSVRRRRRSTLSPEKAAAIKAMVNVTESISKKAEKSSSPVPPESITIGQKQKQQNSAASLPRPPLAPKSSTTKATTTKATPDANANDENVSKVSDISNINEKIESVRKLQSLVEMHKQQVSSVAAAEGGLGKGMTIGDVVQQQQDAAVLSSNNSIVSQNAIAATNNNPLCGMDDYLRNMLLMTSMMSAANQNNKLITAEAAAVQPQQQQAAAAQVALNNATTTVPQDSNVASADTNKVDTYQYTETAKANFYSEEQLRNMSIDELVYLKKQIKNQLKRYDIEFEKQMNRKIQPVDRKPLEQKYFYYHTIKKHIVIKKHTDENTMEHSQPQKQEYAQELLNQQLQQETKEKSSSKKEQEQTLKKTRSTKSSSSKKKKVPKSPLALQDKVIYVQKPNKKKGNAADDNDTESGQIGSFSYDDGISELKDGSIMTDNAQFLLRRKLQDEGGADLPYILQHQLQLQKQNEQQQRMSLVKQHHHVGKNRNIVGATGAGISKKKPPPSPKAKQQQTHPNLKVTVPTSSSNKQQKKKNQMPLWHKDLLSPLPPPSVAPPPSPPPPPVEVDENNQEEVHEKQLISPMSNRFHSSSDNNSILSACINEVLKEEDNDADNHDSNRKEENSVKASAVLHYTIKPKRVNSTVKTVEVNTDNNILMTNTPPKPKVNTKNRTPKSNASANDQITKKKSDVKNAVDPYTPSSRIKSASKFSNMVSTSNVKGNQQKPSPSATFTPKTTIKKRFQYASAPPPSTTTGTNRQKNNDNSTIPSNTTKRRSNVTSNVDHSCDSNNNNTINIVNSSRSSKLQQYIATHDISNRNYVQDIDNLDDDVNNDRDRILEGRDDDSDCSSVMKERYMVANDKRAETEQRDVNVTNQKSPSMLTPRWSLF